MDPGENEMTIRNALKQFLRYEFGLDEIPYIKKAWDYAADYYQTKSWPIQDTDHVFDGLVRLGSLSGEVCGLYNIFTHPDISPLEKTAISALFLGSAEFIKYGAHRFFYKQASAYDATASQNMKIGG